MSASDILNVNQDPEFEAFELIGEASHSDRLSVIVEGSYDIVCYKKMESDLKDKVYFTAVGGKDAVLRCYEEAKRVGATNIVCVADKDLWVIFGVPEKYKGLVLTAGYSIENDILVGSCIHRLFSSPERERILLIKKALSRWYAFYVYEYRNMIGEKHSWPSIHQLINERYDDRSTLIVELNEDELLRENFKEPDPSVVKSILESFELVFRGKSLLQIYERITHKKTDCRPAYNSQVLLDAAVRFATTESHKRLVAGIVKAFECLGRTI